MPKTAQSRSIRIAGLVAAANRTRARLIRGITPAEVATCQAEVRQTLSTVERLCRQAGQSPEHLPLPSRQAYAFLKQLDLDRLPIRHSESSSPQPVRLSRIRSRWQSLHATIQHLACQPNVSKHSVRIAAESIAESIAQIDSQCRAARTTPAQLAGEAKPFYRWLRFLQDPQYLHSHLYAVRQLARHLQALHPAQKGFASNRIEGDEPEQITIEIASTAALYRFRKDAKASKLHVSEGFITAPDEILKDLATTFADGKKEVKTSERLRRYGSSEAFCEILLALELAIAEVDDVERGQHYDLAAVFEQVNREYFGAALDRPQLQWSQTHAQRKFGHYDFARDLVVLSRTLDDVEVPSYMVEFVMYHELLHKQHGVTWVNGRQMAHTPQFRQAEKLFVQYREAEDALKRLSENA